MITLSSPLEFQRLTSQNKTIGRSIGFVPTMGALHEGHLTLIRRAKSECDFVAASVFVNPTQFNDPKDLEKYPRDLNQDAHLLKSVGCDLLFAPNFESVYPDKYAYKMTENVFSAKLCGAHRPGHFDGVLTVVLKLLTLSSCDKAYFGEKDFQQLLLIKGMVQSFFLPHEIVPVPTVREDDGLAMSSRNARLSPQEREKAPLIYQTLMKSKTDQEAANYLSKNGFRVDYVETHFGRRFVAAYLGETRLIDNVSLIETSEGQL